ncbi:helix-turn-helix domain-containing protein [Lactobacillus equicursoris]|uniref:helix-turn-helix domain-containing protein n=1 Tax=Lactobacillus equicursoris TaxID=420645 RepID=UPI0039912111
MTDNSKKKKGLNKMVNQFNSKTLFNNISYLASQQGKKIGELEAAAGVSTGYISRTKEGNFKPGIEVVLNIANELNVSVDTLLNSNLSELTPTEQYLRNLLEKLISDTTNDKLDWNVETADSLNYIQPDENGNTDHPLFSVKTVMVPTEVEYPEEVTRPVFESRTFGNQTCIADDCFDLQLNYNTTLYLMSICKSVHQIGDQNAYAKELWISNNKEQQELCSNRGTETISPLVDELYTVVVESSKHPKIKHGLKSALDSYLENGINEDSIELPF